MLFEVVGSNIKMNQALALLTFLTYEELKSIRGPTEGGESRIGGLFIDVLFNTLRPRKDDIATFFNDDTLKDDTTFRNFIFGRMFTQVGPRQITDTKFCTDTLHMNRDQYDQYCRKLIYNYKNKVRIEW